MIKNIDHFDIRQIADSGQCFRWKVMSDTEVKIVALDRTLTVKKLSEGFSFDCTEEEFERFYAHYFDLETDYFKIESIIMASEDTHLKKCFEMGRGIRILNQDLFEMLVSFMISQNNNIPRIKGSIEAIAKKGGFTTLNDENEFRLPKPGEISPDFFMDKSLGLGYRDAYLKELYEFLEKEPEWPEYLKTLSYEGAKKELLKKKGIGPKVADCVSLFGLHHIDAFPIDTHVKQLLEKYYSQGFDYDTYKGFLGIVQQYLFYAELK